MAHARKTLARGFGAAAAGMATRGRSTEKIDSLNRRVIDSMKAGRYAHCRERKPRGSPRRHDTREASARGSVLLAGVELQAGADGVGDLQGAAEVRVADDEVAVGDERLPPVAARLAGREQVDAGDVFAVVREDML